MTSVLVVDDHPVYRDGLRRLLEAAGHVVAGQAEDGERAVELALLHRPEVVVMDLGLPRLDGVAATARIVEAWPEAAVLVVTMFDDDDRVGRALDAGALGYLLKDASPAQVLHAVETVATGAMVLGPGVAARVRATIGSHLGERGRTPEAAFPELTARERQVLELAAQGLGNAAIAARLGLSAKTVANYVSAILVRLSVPDRASAVALLRDRTGRR